MTRRRAYLHLVAAAELQRPPMTFDGFGELMHANTAHQRADELLHPDDVVAGWDGSVHVPSYRAGWLNGCMTGLFAGAVLVVTCFLLGWAPAP